MISIGFHGAAGTVTGSKYLLTVNNRRYLIDCGMFQGRKALRQRNWVAAPFDATEIDGVVLTHAHIDHVGYLPRLVRLGYTGKIYASAPTCDLTAVSLLDCAHIQEEDAEYRNRKHLTHHEVALPLFTTEDAKEAIKTLIPTTVGSWNRLSDEFRFRMHFAGHLLGAISLEVELDDGSTRLRILFSGDVGRYWNPLTRQPDPPPQTDYLVCESTYGGRLHEPGDVYFQFAQLIDEVVAKKGILLIPAFALGRTQQVAYLVHRLITEKRIPPITVHIDSPMAITATDLYCKYSEYHAVDVTTLGGRKCVLGGGHVKLHRKRKSSLSLNRLKGPAIIMSASGMMTGGRILHHLINRLPNPDTTLAVVGYQAEGTLGRKLVDGDRLVYIHKQPVEVKAKIVNLSGLSGHADYYELLHWLEPIKEMPKQVFITHGEPKQSEAFAGHLKESRQWTTSLLPELDQVLQLA